MGDAAHFDLYGIISPEDLNCLTSDENILCIQQENTQDTAVPGEELPCVQPAACSEVYGVEESHFGLQFACQTSTEVRCVAEVTVTATKTTGSTSSTTVREVTTRPSSEPETLPCLHPSLCLEEYGTLASQFTSHGLFFPLLKTTELTVTRPTTTQRATTSGPTTTRTLTSSPSTTRRSTTINLLFTTQAPLTPPTPAVVNIIGPSPIYIGFNDNHGPSFNHKSETLSMQAGDKNEQIRDLLKLLDERLKYVLKKYPKEH